MGPRWSWDFEDDEKVAGGGASARSPSPPPIAPAATPSVPAWRARRRRGIAALATVAVVVVIVTVLSASHHKAAGSSSPARAGAGRSAAASTAHSHDAPRGPDADQAVASVLAYTPFVREGGLRGRDIALTFDDGPGPYTPGLLEVLERYHVRATFFAIGVMERYFSASTVREIHDGDVIGDHTETHPMLALMSAREQRNQLFEQIARIELLGGPKPRLFRPPYGSFNATTMRELHRLHLLMVLWSVDTGDYLMPGVDMIVQRALAGARPGAIILMHDAGGDRTQTIAALPAIITKLRARGFRLVTVPQLLAEDPPAAGQPLPSNLSGD
jgi:peptidoglycan-N-acetylglucosamine deacetylase